MPSRGKNDGYKNHKRPSTWGNEENQSEKSAWGSRNDQKSNWGNNKENRRPQNSFWNDAQKKSTKSWDNAENSSNWTKKQPNRKWGQKNLPRRQQFVYRAMVG